MGKESEQEKIRIIEEKAFPLRNYLRKKELKKLKRRETEINFRNFLNILFSKENDIRWVVFSIFLSLTGLYIRDFLIGPNATLSEDYLCFILLFLLLIFVYIYHLGEQFRKNFEGISNFDANEKKDYGEVYNKFIFGLYGINHGLTGIFKYEIFYMAIRERKYFFLIISKLAVMGVLAYYVSLYTHERVFLLFLILFVFLPLLLLLNENQLKNFNSSTSLKRNMNLNRIFIESYSYIGIYLLYIIGVVIVLNIEDIISNIPNIVNVQNCFLSKIHTHISLVYITLTIGFLIVFYAMFLKEIFLNREKMLNEIKIMVDGRINKYREFKKVIFDLFFNFDPFNEYQKKVGRGIYPGGSEFKILLYSSPFFFLISIFFLCYPIFTKKLQSGYTWDLSVFILCILFTFIVFHVLIKKYKEYLQIKSEEL